MVCISFVQAAGTVMRGQEVPFAPPDNVTGSYLYSQGNDILELNTNFPISSQDIVFPEWLFGLLIVFMVITCYFGIVFISKEQLPLTWVSVLACGALIFGLGLTAAMMAPLVGYSQVFHQVVPQVASGGATPVNATNTIYVNEIIVYTFGPWVAYACYGIAIGGGIIFMIAGFLLQMAEAKRVADAVQSEKNRDAEDYMRTEQSISVRKRDRL